MLRKILLVCGVFSVLLYVAMNVLVAMQWEGYSSVSQTVSELSAIGAPTRPLWNSHETAGKNFACRSASRRARSRMARSRRLPVAQGNDGARAR